MLRNDLCCCSVFHVLSCSSSVANLDCASKFADFCRYRHRQSLSSRGNKEELSKARDAKMWRSEQIRTTGRHHRHRTWPRLSPPTHQPHHTTSDIIPHQISPDVAWFTQGFDSCQHRLVEVIHLFMTHVPTPFIQVHAWFIHCNKCLWCFSGVL